MAVATLGAPAYAAPPVPGPPGNVFELDGNADLSSSTSTKDDWSNVLYKSPSSVVPAANGHIIATTVCTSGQCDQNWPGVLSDPPGTSIFVNGSKDLSLLSTWTCRDQAAPDKDELLNAYAIAYSVPSQSGTGNDLVAFFGADRFDNSGTATMGFWLLQSSIVQPKCIPAGDGLFRDAENNLVDHSVGDLLVVADFTNGGAIGAIKIFKWVGGKNPLEPVLDTNGSPNYDCTNAAAVGDVCGTINQGPVNSPWNYVPKGASGDSDFIRYGFMEIGVNLSRIFGGTSSVPCFSTFVAETRSSDRPDAAQKDFVLGSFNVCGIGVSKICSNNQPHVDHTPVDFTYDVGGCFTNTGFGPVTTLAITDTVNGSSLSLDNLKFYRPASADETTLITDPTICDSNLTTLQQMATNTGATQISTTATLQPGERIIWLANFTSTSNAATDTVTATAHSVGGPELAPAKDTATCPSVSFSPGITVKKFCDVYLEDTNDQLVVKSRIHGYVCNTGDVPLTNVTVTDSTTPPLTLSNGIPLDKTTLPAQLDPANPDCSDTSDSVAVYDLVYTPNTLPTDGRFTFSDSVIATGTPPTGTGVAPQASDTATCSLCPTCPVCSSPLLRPATTTVKPAKK